MNIRILAATLLSALIMSNCASATNYTAQQLLTFKILGIEKIMPPEAQKNLAIAETIFSAAGLLSGFYLLLKGAKQLEDTAYNKTEEELRTENQNRANQYFIGAIKTILGACIMKYAYSSYLFAYKISE